MNGLKTQDKYAWTQKDRAQRDGLKKTEDVCLDSKDRIPMHGCINIGRLGMDSKLEDTYAWAYTDMGPLNSTQKDRIPGD